MKMKRLLLIALVFVNLGVFAQIPDGYYDGTEDLSGENLKVLLRTIINDGFDGVSYGEARYILDESDADPNNPDNLILVYLGNSIPNAWDLGVTWNREHVWPQSLLGAEASNPTTNIASDLQNLKPADPSENSSRGNDFYDNVSTSDSYVPRDEVKGDVARILFYMITMYDHLALVNEKPGVLEMAKLDVLLEWHEQDTVDAFERNRNDVIYSYQKNRNPFIDHPEYVQMIYNPSTTSISSPTNLAEIKIFPNPANNILNVLAIGEFKVEIYSVIGAKMTQSNLQQIDISNFEAGVYFVVVKNEYGATIKSEKIIKK